MIKYSGADIRQRVECILARIRSERAAIEGVAASTAVGLMTYRIHNQGLDSDGLPIGQYKPLTVKYRRSKGLQTAYVDLQDTGRLFRSQQVVNDGGHLVAAIVGIRSDNRESNADLSYWMEDHFGATIFEPTKDELKAIDAEVDKKIDQILRGCGLL